MEGWAPLVHAFFQAHPRHGKEIRPPQMTGALRKRVNQPTIRDDECYQMSCTAAAGAA